MQPHQDKHLDLSCFFAINEEDQEYLQIVPKNPLKTNFDPETKTVRIESEEDAINSIKLMSYIESIKDLPKEALVEFSVKLNQKTLPEGVLLADLNFPLMGLAHRGNNVILVTTFTKETKIWLPKFGSLNFL